MAVKVERNGPCTRCSQRRSQRFSRWLRIRVNACRYTIVIKLTSSSRWRSTRNVPCVTGVQWFTYASYRVPDFIVCPLDRTIHPATFCSCPTKIVWLPHA